MTRPSWPVMAATCATSRPRVRSRGSFGLLENGDTKPGCAGCGGGLQADPSRADDDNAPALGERGRQLLAVLEPPQVVDAAPIGSWDLQPARSRACGQ